MASAPYPRLLPQVKRMTTGHDPDSAEIDELWRRLLRQVGTRMAPAGGEEE